MDKVKIILNDKSIEVEKGTMLLDAAKELDITIPTLCHMVMQDGETKNCKGTCRVCMVELENRKKLVPACCTEVSDGMVVRTNSPRALNARKMMIELLLSDHPTDCLECVKNANCELQKLAADMGIRKIRYKGEISMHKLDLTSPAIVRDMSKCILCRRCVTACNDVQRVNLLTTIGRGFDSVVSTFFDEPLTESNCTFCGQCIAACPVGALTEVQTYPKVWEMLDNKEKYVVVQTAPAVRVALGEEFNLEPGTITTSKMVGALKALGFDKVFDTNFAADLTIMEEANEFIHRLEKNENLPLITSCCPAWVKFAEIKFKENMNLISTCKSPHQMLGAVTKTYLAEMLNINPEDIVVVSVMPCVAKKNEADREEMMIDDMKDVDLVITTRELATMIKEAGLDIRNIKDGEFDNPLGVSSGAGVIFGSSGGVMEAALRSAYEWITKETLENVNFNEVRGIQGVKEATVNIAGKEINIAVVNSLKNAEKVMKDINAGNSKYQFIEVMACPGGCIGGGGQPYIKGDRNILKKRMEAIYKDDLNHERRKSHENEAILKLYEDYLGEKGGSKAKKILHVHYTK
ncbi:MULTISPECIES: NADH-dependent [FeFe] hydrogenase, group A6 [Clostridium]|uniref:Iron hydrogenase 1 n=2 Tax=Clostridium intestinale TaxID=36845 RepID=U2PQZ7_9CLOT|nr:MULTISPECIES: NADH-dependent [FeFe] hydrogenase, group A6 [Clostridium]ERK28851.1 iron hydrogenase 1 [Clostridium intestinale URNW]ERK28860.1 iron hydrogenase 1 [Clostridium intestinale URNW]QLY80206.1 iron hydrogenase small subunit [Clostridium intestinale]